jgi:large subunit ribosomal protein L24
MQTKLHIKKGDTVKVMAGDSKGQEGKSAGGRYSKNACFVEGVNMASKHTKPNAANPNGGITKKKSVHISNVMLCWWKNYQSRT